MPGHIAGRDSIIEHMIRRKTLKITAFNPMMKKRKWFASVKEQRS